MLVGSVREMTVKKSFMAKMDRLSIWSSCGGGTWLRFVGLINLILSSSHSVYIQRENSTHIISFKTPLMLASFQTFTDRLLSNLV